MYMYLVDVEHINKGKRTITRSNSSFTKISGIKNVVVNIQLLVIWRLDVPLITSNVVLASNLKLFEHHAVTWFPMLACYLVQLHVPAVL